MLPKRTRNLITRINIITLLNKEEIETPMLVINRFRKKFTKSYAQKEILDLLDAVIIYEGSKGRYRGQLVFFYEHLYQLIKLVYRINN